MMVPNGSPPNWPNSAVYTALYRPERVISEASSKSSSNACLDTFRISMRLFSRKSVLSTRNFSDRQADSSFWNGSSCMMASTCRHSLRRSEEHTSELQSLMRISYAVFCLKKKKKHKKKQNEPQ